MTYLQDNSVTRFPGNVWYVDGTNGASGNSGTAPDKAKDTITNGIALMSAGDTLIVAAGTYAEDVEIDVNQTTFIFHHGVVIAGQSADQALLISASYVRMYCEHASLRVNPIATKTGVISSGNWNYLNNIRVPCELGASDAAIGFDITGDGNVICDCRCSGPDTAAFKVQGDKIKLLDCCTGGDAGKSSIGFWFTNSCDKARIKYCGSQGHETAGFQVDTGCTNGVIEDCYSGGGDGKSTDADNSFVWSKFHYDRVKYTTATFTTTGGVGGTGTAYNLFKITGTVRVFNIFGHVTNVLPNTSSVPKLQVYSTNGTADITDSSGGPDIDSACVGALLKRLEPATEPLVYANPDGTPTVTESANYRDPHVPVLLTKDDSADTYVQLVLSAALASGAMHWHIEWEPVTDDGFVEVA